MSFDLVVWEQPRLKDDATAAEYVRGLYGALETGGTDAEWSVALDKFVAACEIRWNAEDTESPWASWPVDRSPDAAFLNLKLDKASSVIDQLVALAARFDLMVFDPQSDRILKLTPQRSRWWSRG